MSGQHQNQIKELPRLLSFNLENIFNVYKDNDGSYFYNILNSIHLPDDLHPNVYYEYVVENSNLSWTNLSYKLYGTIRLWWVICLANKIDNPIKFPSAGQVLKIIRTEYVREILMGLKERK